MNLKFTLWLLVSLMVMTAGVYRLHAFQVKRNAGIFKHQAQQAGEANRLDEASFYYGRYLKYSPADTDAQIAWAQILEKKTAPSYPELRRVMELYESVLRQDADNHEIRRKLINVAIRLGRLSDAQQHIEILLKGPGADDGKLEQLHAFCFAAKNDNPKAKEFYERSIKHAPRHLASYVQLAELHARLAEPNEADAVMKKLVEANDRDYQAHLIRARYLRPRGSTEEIARETRRAYDLAQDSPETLLAMAEVAQLRQAPEEARRYLQEGLDRFPDNAGMYLALAQMEMTAHRTDEAAACLRRGLKEVPAQSHNGLLYKLALCLIQRGEKNETEEIIKKLVQRQAAGIVIEELQARVLLAKGQWSEAAALLEKLLKGVMADAYSAGQVNLLLGVCYEKRGEADRALIAYDQALAANPHSTTAHEGKAAALVALGRAEDALGEYLAVMKQDPAVGSKVALLLIRRNVRAEKAKRDWHAVDQALDAAARASPDATEVVLVRAQALLAQEKAKEASALLEKTCRAQPAKLELWLARAELAAAAETGTKALDILGEAEARLGDRVELRLARAVHWWRDARTAGQAPALLSKLEENTGHFSQDDQVKLWRGLGDLYYRAANTTEAKRLWRQAAAKAPQDMQIRLALFDLAVRENDQEAMQQISDEIKILDGQGTMWRYARASRILAGARAGDKSGLGEARRLLREVINQRGFWGPPYRSLAAIDEIEGNSQRALEHYQQALDLGDRNPHALRRVIQLLWNQQRYTEADQLLKNADDQGTLPLEWRRVQAALRAQEKDHDNAIALARRAIDIGSKDPLDYVWLGQILWAAGDVHAREAEAMLRRATEMPGAERSSESWVALVQFLARSKRIDQAHAVINEARRKLAEAPRTLALAQCYEALEEFAKAATEFKAALKTNPDDFTVLRNVAGFYLRQNQPSSAEPYLRKILDPATRAPDSDRVWARRGLAVQMANQGDYQHYKQALAMVEENTRQGNGTLEDQRTLAELLSAHPRKRREAIRILESLQVRQPLTLEQLKSLAELHEAVHDWPKARKVFNALAANSLSAQEPRPPYAFYSARALMRHGDVSDAELWLQKLAGLESGSLMTLDLQIRLLKAQNRIDDALVRLKEYVKEKDANLELAAGLFEELGQAGLAEENYRKWMSQASAANRGLVLAGFLGRQDRADEALDLCERAARLGSLEAAAAVSVSLVRESRDPREQQFQRVERLLDEVSKKNPADPGPFLQLAELRQLQHRYAEAEAFYRRVLDKNNRNIVALNNLAWLLVVYDNKMDEAMQTIERAIGLVGEFGHLLDTRAIIFIKQGAMKEAVEDLHKALEDQETASRYFHLAQAQRAQDRRAAVESLRRARELQLARGKIDALERKDYDLLLEALDEK